MKLNAQTPKQSLNRAFLKQPVSRDEITLFKANLQTLLSKINGTESEEHHKNFVRDFLKNTFYKADYEINTKGRQDLVIHVGKSAREKVGVILEAKKPTNKADMISADNPNRKALHELVLYFLRERIDENNVDVKYLIVTNINEWFIFEASVFNQLFFENKTFVKDYKQWRDRQKTTVKTDLFYNEIARPFIESIETEIACAYFDIRKYETALKNDDTKTDESLIELFKILSPQHLLKIPFADDSNRLDKNFYTELLHIVGLEEIKDKGKLKIERKAADRRDAGSLIENAIAIIETKDSLHKVKNLETYGATRDERLFGVALELCLTWINRVLFLKLLEAQMVDYHKGNRDYRFLDIQTIQDFDELFTLFHQVLAKLPEERRANIQAKYNRVPYLNSSLFEISELEADTITVESLKDTIALSFINSTVLKDIKAKQNGLPTLEYLFKFLDAYDFAGEGASAIKENNRSLINASVLGKVFEKINGYKDGSIYTPGFITMYMCRQAIRLAVVQKFKDKYEIDIETFEDLQIYVGRFYKTANILEFNRLFNSLRLCDPAVGSGHFLVSSLNEIIAVKSELGILADENGKPFPNIEITVEADELTVFDTDRNEFFKYQITDGKPNSREMQRLQKTLFGEKQSLIENCLFGVDINANSVKICRLRLWIELLKNAYYKEGGNTREVSVSSAKENALTHARASAFSELETLPNIDINIKTGNSLVSRFALDADLKEVLKNKKNIIEQYRKAVADYKNERNRDKKRELLKIIDEIKGDFRTEIYKHHPKMRELLKAQRRFDELNSRHLFEKYNEFEKEISLRQVQKEIDELNSEIEAIKSNAIYRNAFEWRFEFPEVLDDDGNFTGFDIVIGNPPYGFRNVLTPENKVFFRKEKKLTFSSGDVAELFIVISQKFVKDNGILTFIIPKKSLYGESWANVRKFWLENDLRFLVDTSKAFENVLLEMNAFLIFKNKEKSQQSITIGTTEFKANEIKFFGTFPFDEIFTDDLANAQIYRGSYSKDFLQKIKEKSYESKVIKGEIGISNITSALTFEVEGNFPCVKGFDIEKYGLKEEVRYLKKEIAERYIEDYKHPKIIAQEIIAHIQNPIPHIEIIAFFDEKGRLFNDTCVEIIPLRDDLNKKFLLAYLQSKFCNWYCYNFIYNRAIRTMHFIDYYVSQIPIPRIEEKDQQPFVALVNQILELKKAGKDTLALESEIDKLVYRLYDLTDDEIKIVEGRS
ncbi:MAG: DUF7149 domain-containing protein [Pyrinomonadaceae bacterium]